MGGGLGATSLSISYKSILNLVSEIALKNCLVIKNYLGKIETNLLQVSLTGHSLVSVEQTGEQKEKVISNLEE
jgi:hypothetical protein